MTSGFTRRRLWLVCAAFLAIATLSVAGCWYFSTPEPDERLAMPIQIAGKTCLVNAEFFTPKNAAPVFKRPAVVLLHGVEGPHNFRRDRNQTAALLARQGYAVFVVHYMNGMSYDDLYLFSPSGELDIAAIEALRKADAALWVSSVKQVLSQIAARNDVDSSRICLFGHSMGSFLSLAVAADLTKNNAPEKPCCLVINWGSVWSDTRIPAQFPECLFIHGEKDTIVEPKWAHYAVDQIHSAGGSAELVLVPGAGHIARSAESDAKMLQFLAKHMR